MPATRAQLRRAAHHAADLIYEALTGERGAFNTRIAYVTATGSAKSRLYELQVADSDGYGPQTIVRSKEPIMSPTWAPDASRIAYVSFEKRRAEIYVQDMRTGTRSVAAKFAGINGAPAALGIKDPVSTSSPPGAEWGVDRPAGPVRRRGNVRQQHLQHPARDPAHREGGLQDLRGGPADGRP